MVVLLVVFALPPALARAPRCCCRSLRVVLASLSLRPANSSMYEMSSEENSSLLEPQKRVEDAEPVDWLAELSRFDYGQYLLAAVIFLAAEITLRVAGPRQVPFYVSDATVWYPFLPETVPMFGVVLFACFTVPCMALLEVLAMNGTGRRRLFAAARFALAGATAAVHTLAFVEFTKFFVGELRPYFGTLCTGLPMPPAQYDGRTILSNDMCTGTATEAQLNEARMSFLSGHASVSFALAVTLAAHLWLRAATIARASSVSSSLLSAASIATWKRRAVSQVLCVVAWLPLGFAGWVALTRVRDFRHHVWDITSGSALGVVLGLAIFVPIAHSIHQDYYCRHKSEHSNEYS